MCSGQTRSESTTTEAESYLRLALLSNLLQTLSNDPPSHQTHPAVLPFQRATSENHALDSFQNLLFSIARFHEYTGRWPEHITVVGYEMKRRRFEELHREALRWPASRFTYVGIDGKWEGTVAQKGEVRTRFNIHLSLCDRCVAVPKRVQTIHARHVWLPLESTLQTPKSKPIFTIPLVLYIVTGT
jgi:hypothetical protein